MLKSLTCKPCSPELFLDVFFDTKTLKLNTFCAASLRISLFNLGKYFLRCFHATFTSSPPSSKNRVPF